MFLLLRTSKKYQYKLPTQFTLPLLRAQTVDELSENMCIIRNEVLFYFSSSCITFNSVFTENEIICFVVPRKATQFYQNISSYQFDDEENWRKMRKIDKSHNEFLRNPTDFLTFLCYFVGWKTKKAEFSLFRGKHWRRRRKERIIRLAQFLRLQRKRKALQCETMPFPQITWILYTNPKAGRMGIKTRRCILFISIIH